MLSQRLCAHTQAMMRRRIRACVRGAPMRACFLRASIVGPGAMLEDAAAHSVRKIGKLSDVCCTAVSAPPERPDADPIGRMRCARSCGVSGERGVSVSVRSEWL